MVWKVGSQVLPKMKTGAKDLGPRVIVRKDKKVWVALCDKGGVEKEFTSFLIALLRIHNDLVNDGGASRRLSFVLDYLIHKDEVNTICEQNSVTRIYHTGFKVLVHELHLV